MEPRHHAFEAKAAGLDGEAQSAIAPLHAEVEEEGHQPVVRWNVVVLRQDFFHPGGRIFSGRKVCAEQQKILGPEQRRELGQDHLWLKVRDHAKKSDQ